MIRERANCLKHGRPAPPAGPAVQFGARRGCLNHRNRPAPAASTRCCTASSCGYENPRDWSAQLAAPSEMQRAYEGPRGHPRIAHFFRHAASTVERCKIALTYSDKDEHDR